MKIAIVVVGLLVCSCGGSSFEGASTSPDLVSPIDAGAAGRASGEAEASSSVDAARPALELDAGVVVDASGEAEADAPCMPSGCLPRGNCCTKEGRCGMIESSNGGQSLVCVALQ